MMLPLGDSPNPRGVPVMTYALLAANVAVYLFITLPLSVTPADPSDPTLPAYVRVVERELPRRMPVEAIVEQTSAYDLFVFRNGFRPAAPSLANLFFSLFLHAGLFHLFGNMLFLWIYGDNVEHRLGPFRYLIAYLGTGVAATLFHTAFDLDSQLPVVGASGAISGVLGFYFRWFPRNQVRLLLLIFPFLIDVIMVPARLVLGLFLLVDNLLPFLVSRGLAGGGVAYGAHIGGFIAGLSAAWVMDRRALRTTPREFEAVTVTPDVVGTPAAAIEQALAENQFATAADIYFALHPDATRRILSPAASLQLADWLRAHGHDDAALIIYQRHLRDYPRGPGLAEAHLGAGLVQLERMGQPTPAYQHFLAVLDLDPAPEIAVRARQALDEISRRQKFQVGRRRAPHRRP
jgi:membrane associated rhomboid family serine protease